MRSFTLALLRKRLRIRLLCFDYISSSFSRSVGVRAIRFSVTTAASTRHRQINPPTLPRFTYHFSLGNRLESNLAELSAQSRFFGRLWYPSMYNRSSSSARRLIQALLTGLTNECCAAFRYNGRCCVDRF